MECYSDSTFGYSLYGVRIDFPVGSVLDRISHAEPWTSSLRIFSSSPKRENASCTVKVSERSGHANLDERHARFPMEKVLEMFEL